MQMQPFFSTVGCAVYIHGAVDDIIAIENDQRGMLAIDLFKPRQQLTKQAVNTFEKT